MLVLQAFGADETLKMGILADEITGLADIQETQIGPSPSVSTTADRGVVWGMGSVGEGVVTLVNVDCVLSSNELMGTDQIER